MMHRDNDQAAAVDAQLRERFAALRRSELAQCPAVPDLAGGRASPARESNRVAGAAALALAATVLVAVGIVWRGAQPAPDSARLYADIMAGAAFPSDALLAPGHGVAPESLGVPGVLELWSGAGEEVP